MKITYSSFYLLIFLVIACQSVNDDLLIGKWKTAVILEEGEPLAVTTEEIGIEFQSDHSYRFSSTLNYREAGSYFIDGRFLYTTDTINQASSEKAVEILILSEDSLYLRMQENGKERILKLARSNR